MNDPATKYAKDVCAGRILSCKWVRLACERHIRDLKRGEWRWDVSAVNRALNFMRLLRHYKGEFAGRSFEPSPWQCFVVGSIFGWKSKTTGLRRFRYALVKVPRKNGKTFLGAAIGLIMLFLDGEPAAEVYSLATKEEQARIIWRDGVNLVRKSPGLGSVLRCTVSEIQHADSISHWRALGSDSKTLDGLNPHAALIDELHAWPRRGLWDIVDSGKGARRQPLLFQISTEGELILDPTSDDQRSIFDEQCDIVQKLLEDRDFADTTCANYFGIIYTIDDGDDPFIESSWRKANPELGGAKNLETMHDDARKAKLSAAKLRDFEIKQLNVRRGKSASGWLAVDSWDACCGEKLTQSEILQRVAGKEVWCGFDASRSQDLAAVALVWFEGEIACVAWLFFTPEDTLAEREIKDRSPYAQWVRLGWLTATDGNVTDYRAIEASTINVLRGATARAFWYDPSHGHECAMNVRDEVGMHDVMKIDGGGEWHQVSALAQTFSNFSRPYREIERRVIAGTLRHFGNPVARSNIINAVPHVGPSENIMLHKGRSRGRIDGAVALGMAFAAALTMPRVDDGASLGLCQL